MNEMKYRRKGGFLITKIHQLTSRIFSDLLQKYDISELDSSKGRIMFALWKKDKRPIYELVEETQLSKSTITAMLDKLEESGFIERRPSKQDRREVLIYLTLKDKSMQSKYIEVSKEMTNIFYQQFMEHEIDEFEEMLSRILENLKKYEENNH
nr:MarR transcriptional regulator [Candidatus Lokiarchaeota archaeon]